MFTAKWQMWTRLHAELWLWTVIVNRVCAPIAHLVSFFSSPLSLLPSPSISTLTTIKGKNVHPSLHCLCHLISEGSWGAPQPIPADVERGTAVGSSSQGWHTETNKPFKLTLTPTGNLDSQINLSAHGEALVGRQVRAHNRLAVRHR